MGFSEKRAAAVSERRKKKSLPRSCVMFHPREETTDTSYRYKVQQEGWYDWSDWDLINLPLFFFFFNTILFDFKLLNG